MSKAMQLVGIILLGSITLVIIYLISDARSTNELDYYLLQEVTEASMYDAVDYSYYRESGLLKVDRDMFLESFTRRFAESVDNNRDYDIKIIDFNETPPKVSIEVTAPTVASVKGEVALITNRVSGIIESIYDDYVYSRGLYGSDNFDSSPATITFTDKGNNNYAVLIADDYVIYGYKVLKLNDSNRHSSSNICSMVDSWDEPVVNGKSWLSTYAFELSLSGEEGYWIAVMDGASNCVARQLSDVAPWFKSLTYDATPSITNLVSTFADDHGLIRYYIAPSNWSTSDVIKNCGSNSNLCKAVDIKGMAVTEADGSIIYQSSIDIKLNELGLDYGKTYRLFVLDNNNHMTKSTQDLLLRKPHVPSVEYAYNPTSSTTGTLTLTINDSGNDLYGYYYSTESYAPVNDSDYKYLSPSGQTFNLNSIGEDVHYIWVRDKQGDVKKIALNIDLEAIKEVPKCESGGKLIKNNTMCEYKSNKSQCGSNSYYDNCASTKNTCQGGYEQVPSTCYDRVYNQKGSVSTREGGGCGLYCRGKLNCTYSTGDAYECDNLGNCMLECTYSYDTNPHSCLVNGKWNDCLTGNPNECVGGWKDGSAKDCEKPSTLSYSCSEGYTKPDNNKACFKITAS